MTYEEQLKIEQQNKEILASIDGEALIEFYKTHNRKETKEKFGIRTDKQLVKALTMFGYDFSIKKALNKGKPSTRSHESYVEAGKKSSATQQKHWEEKSEEEKKAWSDLQIAAHSSEETRQKISLANQRYQASLTAEQKEEIRQQKRSINRSVWAERGEEIIAKSRQTCLEKYGVPNFAKSEEYRNIISSEENLQQRAARNYATKSQNNSFSSSKPEDDYYEYLCKKFGAENVISQYRDEERYPFNCDFYVKSLDLFIELNLSWTHGGHVFNGADPDDQAKLAIWAERAKTSDYYKNAISVWTERDPMKIETAKKHNLNYKIIYTVDELYND